MMLGLLVTSENMHKVYLISSGFLTIWGPPLKIKILKSGIVHAREDQKIDPEPKFHVRRSSNGKDYGGQPKRGQFLTLAHMGTPLKSKFRKSGFDIF